MNKGNKTILVIDDDKHFLKLVSRYLTEISYSIICCEDSRLAIEIIEETPPDLILVDIHMPQVDGFQLSQSVKQFFPNSLIPIIIMTGSGDEFAIEKAYDSGAHDFIVKSMSWPWVALDYKLRYLLQAHDAIKISQIKDQNEGLIKELNFQKYALDEHCIVSTTDDKGNIIYVNKKFCQISGYTEEECLGRNHRFIKSDEHSPEFYQNLWATITSGKTWHGQLKNTTKSGGYYWVDATIVPFMDNRKKPFRYDSILTDITSQKDNHVLIEKTNRNLQTLSQCNEAIVKSLSEKSLLNEICQVIVEENFDVCAAWVGYKMDDSGLTVSQQAQFGFDDSYIKQPACTWNDNATGCGPVGLSIKTAQPVIINDVLTDPRYTAWQDDARQQGYLSCIVLPLFDHRHVLGVVCIYSQDKAAFDVEFVKNMQHLLNNVSYAIQHFRTEDARKKTEIALLQAKAVAEKANKAKSEFLSSMSHELRTPLNSILGFAQLLQMDELKDKEQYDNVQYIYESGHHLLALINEVLDLAEIEADGLELSIESVSLKTLVKECLAVIQPIADKSEIEVTIPKQIDQDIYLLADHIRIKQVFINLLSNAIKYNCSQGKVNLSWEVIEQSKIRFQVTDTGIGIIREKQDSIFQPFNRLEMANSNIEGTGIGLVICKILLEKMHGKIGFSSEENKGSVFWFELPVSTNSYSENSPKNTQNPDYQELPVNEHTVLYIEDNPSSLQLMKSIFKRFTTLTLLCAHNAELGIDIASAKRPDLIIMDINLPGMNGHDALMKLISLKETRDIPVIALSAVATPNDIKEGEESGFLRYLTKPVDVTELIEVIKRFTNT